MRPSPPTLRFATVLSHSLNMVYLAHFVRPNFAPLTLRKTSDIPEPLGEISSYESEAVR